MTRWKSHLPGLQTAPMDSPAGSPANVRAQSWIDHPRVEDFLRQFVARHRRLTLLRRTGWAATIALGWLLCSCLADRLFDLPRALRFLWLLSDLLIPAALILPPLRRLLARQMDWTAAADHIERLTPVFGQRLQTAASQMAAPVSQRGSKVMLDSILREVDRELEALQPASLISWSPILRAWYALAILAVLCGSLLAIPGLGLPRLIARAVDPWKALSPVTTTVLAVDPGDARVPQGRDLNVTVAAKRLGDDLPVIALTEDGVTWQRQTMNYISADHFSFVISSIDRDLKYFIQGGDAQSPSFNILALRTPTIAEFHVRYRFPDYVLGSPSLPVTSTDGIIAAPVGTEAIISAISTEPLASATLRAGNERIDLTPTLEPTIRECKIRIEHDEKLELSLLSERGIAGSGPPTMAIRAIPDAAPAIRFTQPTEDLRLAPDDTVPIGYVASDDYGVVSVGIRAQVNLSPGREFGAVLTGNPQYRRGTFMLDLSGLDLKVGDLVRLCLVARDTGGHETIGSEERFILISPRGVDSHAHVRMTELRRARNLAELLSANLESAGKSIENALRQSGYLQGGDPQVFSAARDELSSAADAAALLRQALLRTVVHADSPQMSVVLAQWLDQTQASAGAAELAAQSLDTAAQSESPARLASAAAVAKQLQADLATVAGGEVAAAMLTHEQDMAAASTRPAQSGDSAARDSGVRESVARESAVRESAVWGRLEQEFREQAAMLKLDPGAADLSARLSGLTAQEQALLARQTPADFVAVARAWAAKLSQGRQPDSDLDARLSVAAQAEALRPDGDLIRARDLELSGRAAAAIASSALAAPNTTAAQATAAPEQYPGALADIGRENEFARGSSTLSAVQRELIHNDAEAARQKMAIWAGETATARRGGGIDQDQKSLDAAMAANAAMARGNYAAAAKVDELLTQDQSATQPAITTSWAQTPGASSDVATNPAMLARQSQRTAAEQQVRIAMKNAQSLELLRARQDQLRADAERDARSEGLPQRQQSLADDIRGIDRDRSTDAPQLAAAAPQNSNDAPNTPNALIDRDPLRAAKFFSQQAALELAHPGTGAATDLQRSASAALARAWEQSLHQAAGGRFEQVGSLASILNFDSYESDFSPADGRSFAALAARSSDRSWGRLQARNPQSLSAGLRESNPPGYDESVKAYFEALNRMGS